MLTSYLFYIPIISGLLMGAFLNTALNLNFLLSLLAINALALIIGFISYQNKKIFFLCMILALFLSGFIFFKTGYTDKTNIISAISALNPDFYEGKISDINGFKKGTFNFKMKINNAVKENKKYQVNEELFLEIRSPRMITNLKPGNTILVKAKTWFSTDIEDAGYRKYAIQNNLLGSCYLYSTYQTSIVNSTYSTLKNFYCRLTDKIYSQISYYIKWPENSLSYALITGKKDHIPVQIKDNFRITGTYHLLAVSGMHAGILLLLFFSIFSFFNINKKVSLMIIFFIIFPLYIFITHFQISIIRTYCMSLLGFFCFLYGRKAVSIPVFLCTFLIICIADTSQLHSISFQLSFSAVFGILLSLMIMHKYKISKKVYQFIIISIGAQLFTAPFLIYYFGYINYFTMFYNIFLSFMISLSMIFSVIFIILPFTLFNTSIGNFLSVINGVIFKFLDLTSLDMEIYHISMQGRKYTTALIFILIFVGYLFILKRKGKFKSGEKYLELQ